MHSVAMAVRSFTLIFHMCTSHFTSPRHQRLIHPNPLGQFHTNRFPDPLLGWILLINSYYSSSSKQRSRHPRPMEMSPPPCSSHSDTNPLAHLVATSRARARAVP